MGFIDVIKEKAKADKKTIVLPETEDKRTYEAAEAVLKEGTANLVLVGSKEEIEKNGAGFDISGATIVDPATYEKTEAYIAKLVELRQKKGMTKEQAKEKAVAALKLVGLEQLADENPYDLELSERKLVAIASVLAMDTKVLILDEPTIAQDWKGRKIIQKMIRDLSSQGKTVIAILHDMDFVAESFERVIVMAHGKVLADGTKEEVFAQKDVLEQARIDQPYLTKLCQQLGYKNLYFSLKD